MTEVLHFVVTLRGCFMLTKNGQDEKVAAIFLINSKFITGFEVFATR